MTKTPDLLSLKSTADLQTLRWQDYADHNLTDQEFRHILKLCDAFWLHSGNPKDPHAELTSGHCSNGFIDTLRALRFTPICQLLAHQSYKKITSLYKTKFDWVVGSDHAGATFSYALATFFNAQHDFTEKGPDKTQIWKRFTIGAKEVVLQAEELVATSGTLLAVREGLRQGNPEPVTFAPFVFTLVHRSETTEIEKSKLEYLFHFDIWKSEQKDCPLCAAGSKRLRPKKNWAELTKP